MVPFESSIKNSRSRSGFATAGKLVTSSLDGGCFRLSPQATSAIAMAASRTISQELALDVRPRVVGDGTGASDVDPQVIAARRARAIVGDEPVAVRLAI